MGIHEQHSILAIGLLAGAAVASGAFDTLRFGGYGEVSFQHLDYGADRYTRADGAPSANRSLVDVPRVNFALDYRFSPALALAVEMEFEHGGTGSAMELEYDEAGEYEAEVEKGGEVELEEIALTYSFGDLLEVAVGHMVVPVGTVNSHHLPIEFFGTARSEGQATLVPATWHETGISLSGSWWLLSWQAMLVNGLDANGFSSAYWVAGGKQGAFEEIRMTDPAMVGRLEANVPAGGGKLRLGACGYTGNSAGNTSKPENMAGIDGRVSIASADLELRHGGLVLRSDVLGGWLADSYRISAINKSISRNLGVARTPVASRAMAWSAEVGFDVLSFAHSEQKLFPFARHERYDAMAETQGGILADKRHERMVTTLGLDWFPRRNVVVKLDYAMRELGGGSLNDENTVGATIAYTGWFWSR